MGTKHAGATRDIMGGASFTQEENEDRGGRCPKPPDKHGGGRKKYSNPSNCPLGGNSPNGAGGGGRGGDGGPPNDRSGGGDGGPPNGGPNDGNNQLDARKSERKLALIQKKLRALAHIKSMSLIQTYKTHSMQHQVQQGN